MNAIAGIAAAMVVALLAGSQEEPGGAPAERDDLPLWLVVAVVGLLVSGTFG